LLVSHVKSICGIVVSTKSGQQVKSFGIANIHIAAVGWHIHAAMSHSTVVHTAHVHAAVVHLRVIHIERMYQRIDSRSSELFVRCSRVLYILRQVQGSQCYGRIGEKSHK
jgi:hypothetical protein